MSCNNSLFFVCSGSDRNTLSIGSFWKWYQVLRNVSWRKEVGHCRWLCKSRRHNLSGLLTRSELYSFTRVELQHTAMTQRVWKALLSNGSLPTVIISPLISHGTRNSIVDFTTKSLAPCSVPLWSGVSSYKNILLRDSDTILARKRA